MHVVEIGVVPGRAVQDADPGMPPTSIETLALAVCVGSFQLTCAVFVTVVPIARFGVERRPEPQHDDRARLQRRRTPPSSWR